MAIAKEIEAQIDYSGEKGIIRDPQVPFAENLADRIKTVNAHIKAKAAEIRTLQSAGVDYSYEEYVSHFLQEEKGHLLKKESFSRLSLKIRQFLKFTISRKGRNQLQRNRNLQ